MLRPPLTVSRQFFEGTKTSLNRRLRGFRRYDPDRRFQFKKPVSFSSARTMKRFPSPRCASAIQIVRQLESMADTQPQLQPALLRLSAMISQYFILCRAWLLFVEQRG